MKSHIELLQENIKRLEQAINSAYTFQQGYINNCKQAIESYKKQIAILQGK